jgi:hypothetical protein
MQNVGNIVSFISHSPAAHESWHRIPPLPAQTNPRKPRRYHPSKYSWPMKAELAICSQKLPGGRGRARYALARRHENRQFEIMASENIRQMANFNIQL